MESRFHVMRYVLLASLAGSDILFLILGNSPSIASTAHERWLYGETMCKLHYLVLRYFYLNTVLHLIAVSYERYSAIVKSPLTYDGSITRSKVVVIVLIWTVPVLVVATAFFRQAESAFIIRNCSFAGQLQMPLLFMLPLRHSSCSLCQFQ